MGRWARSCWWVAVAALGWVGSAASQERLNAREQQGKTVFIRACAQCHGGPTVIRYHSVASTLPTGFVGGWPAFDDWNKFDMPALRGIHRTAPYFHNNSAATLEAVVAHYVQFFKRVQASAAPGVVPPVASTDGVHFDRIPAPEERPALLAYLRKL